MPNPNQQPRSEVTIGRNRFNQERFNERFGERIMEVGKSSSDGRTMWIEKVKVADEYGRLAELVAKSEAGGDASVYCNAVCGLAHFIGQEMDEATRGQWGDAAHTENEAARVLRDMPQSDETQQLIVGGQDWVALSDTKTNQDVPHYADDRTSVDNSFSFGHSTADEIIFRGCGYVIANVVPGEDEYYNGNRSKRHSPWRVETRVKGFKPESFRSTTGRDVRRTV
jgi:hypothetical protein